MKDEIIQDAKFLCIKFISKVESGRAYSKETYAECKGLLAKITRHEINATIKEAMIED